MAQAHSREDLGVGALGSHVWFLELGWDVGGNGQGCKSHGSSQVLRLPQYTKGKTMARPA